MPVTELYAFNLICENLLAALYGVALGQIKSVSRYGNFRIGIFVRKFDTNRKFLIVILINQMYNLIIKQQ